MRPYREAHEDEAASNQHSHDALQTQQWQKQPSIGVRKSSHGL
jgi:hypothetical protein